MCSDDLHLKEEKLRQERSREGNEIIKGDSFCIKQKDVLVKR